MLIDMTDLEMTRLCAEVMGIDTSKGYLSAGMCLHCDEYGLDYDPLHDDAQAMALVKRLKLLVNNGVGEASTDVWHVQTQDDKDEVVQCQNLNRAIVECVAKMQAAR